MRAKASRRCCDHGRRSSGRRRAARGGLAGAALLASLWLAPPVAVAHPFAFAPPLRYAAGDGIRALAAADFDADGSADVLVRNPSGRLTIHRGDGLGALAGIVPVAGVAPAAMADVDGRAAPDLLDVVERDGDVVLRGRLSAPLGGFAAMTETAVGPLRGALRGWATGEFDGEPGTDVMLLAAQDGSVATALWVASGAGDGTFGRAEPAGSTPGGSDVLALPDVNADGRQEIATRDAAGGVWVSESTLPRGFAPAIRRRGVTPGAASGPMTVGRFAPGGPPVLAVADPLGACIVLLPLVTGAVRRGRCFPSSGRVQALTAADLDGDGTTELVHGRSGGGLALMRGRDGRIGRPRLVDLGPASFSSDPLAADLDGDGRLDLVAVADLRSLVVLRNLGRPEPEPVPSVPVSS